MKGGGEADSRFEAKKKRKLRDKERDIWLKEKERKIIYGSKIFI